LHDNLDPGGGQTAGDLRDDGNAPLARPRLGGNGELHGAL